MGSINASNAGSDEVGDSAGVPVVVAVLSRSSGASADDVLGETNVRKRCDNDCTSELTPVWQMLRVLEAGMLP